jgi:hypothetical protein
MQDIVLSAWLERHRGRVAAELLQAVIAGQVPPVWAERAHLLPKDIPARPDLAYGRNWRGWDDFLGATGWDEWCDERAKMYRRGLH